MKILLTLISMSVILSACDNRYVVYKRCVNGDFVVRDGDKYQAYYTDLIIEDPEHYCPEDKNFWAYVLKK